MDSHLKVMTVSYGTFSCTLDGFDDPFTTMQLVAEYFRKLSADDRYFGSEPLQPDVSALHQIAKSANPNRIDAEVSDNSVVLRQADVVDAPSADTIATQKPSQSSAPLRKTAPQKDARVAPSSDDTDLPTAFSSRRKAVVREAAFSDTATDSLITAFNESVNDIITADELAPSQEDEIPSATVSAAVKALESGESVDRWLETTNEKMATPEHFSKANALERLKAAVAATEAERTTRLDNLTSDIDIETGDERRDNTISFRRELAKVRKAYEHETSIFSRQSKPKSRASGKNGTSSPLVLKIKHRITGTSKDTGQGDHKNKAGLKIVSGQNKQSNKKPASSTTTARTASKSGLPSFSEFAKMMGASTLTELLEASAAYMTLVHGKNRFSGRQITANLPQHIKKIVKVDECMGALDRLNKRGFVKTDTDGSYAISIARKAAYQKKYLAG
jgi:hypothetical protein